MDTDFVKMGTTLTASLLLCALLSACSTVKMPNVNFPSIPEFREAAQKLVEGFPEVSKAPMRPTDLRDAAAWDAAAKALMTERAGFNVPSKGDMPATAAEIDAELAALKAELYSYKLDDPQ